MAFDTIDDRAEGEAITPAQIAHNSLFNAREKIELLSQLKADATAAGEEGRETSFTPEEIDRALAEVHQDVQDGVGTDDKGGL